MRTRLFLHCGLPVPYLAQIAAMVPGLECYPERSLLLARRGDVVCLSVAVDPAYLAYLAALEIGPDPEDIVLVPPSEDVALQPLCLRILDRPHALARLARRLSAADCVDLYPFIVSREHFAVATALAQASGVAVGVVGGDPRLVELADRKDYMRVKAQELGVPVADGEIVRLPRDGRGAHGVACLADAIARRLERTGRVLVRGASGTSGSSAWAVRRGEHEPADVAREIVGRTDNDTYLVEVMVEATASPNIQMHVAPDDGSITCVGVTEQRWSRPLSHAGNLFPCTAAAAADMIRWSYQMTDWLRSQGYVGVAGFDFVEYRDDRGRPQVLFAEVNPRVNGATFPLALLDRLNERQRRCGAPEHGAFVSGSIETAARSFAELEALAGHLFYTPGSPAGVVPYLSGLLPFGKCAVAVLGRSSEDAAQLFDELRAAARAAR